MIAKTIMLLTLWVSTSCARVPYDFAEYVARFNHFAKVHGCNVSTDRFEINFGDPLPAKDGSYPVGECFFFEKRIIIKKSLWDRSGEWRREQLMFHELGHCELREKHRPNTIMQASLLQPSYYYENRNFLIEHLFHGCNK